MAEEKNTEISIKPIWLPWVILGVEIKIVLILGILIIPTAVI